VDCVNAAGLGTAVAMPGRVFGHRGGKLPGCVRPRNQAAPVCSTPAPAASRAPLVYVLKPYQRSIHEVDG